MDGRSAADPDKYNKLKDKYNQLKEAARKEVQEKSELCAKLERQLKEKEATLRQQLEEIDSLKFQNGRLSKQLGILNAQLEEQQKSKQQSGWSVQGLISGNQHQEAIKQAQDEAAVLRDELMMKINENEELHMNLAEVQRLFEEESQRFRESSAASCSELEQKASDLEVERSERSRLVGETQEMTQRIASLEEQLSKVDAFAGSLQCSLRDERRAAAAQADGLRAQLSRWVPFDEAQHEAWNHWNCSPWRGREHIQRHQAMQQLQASVTEACRLGCGVFQMWSRVFGSGSDDEPSSRVQIRSKMSDMASRLVTILSETVPELIGPLCLAQARPDMRWERHFKKSARAFLHIHQKWVTYQSLLLLHDWSSAFASRSPQEDLQAQTFVDCLWQLHRCLKSLFSKLSLFTCMTVLMTRSCSSAHFNLARATLRASRRREGRVPLAGHDADGADELHPVAMAGGDGASLDAVPSAGEALVSRASAVLGGFTGSSQLSRAPSLLLERAQSALQDVSQRWEGIGRCLSAWTTAQATAPDAAGQDSKLVAELLESINRLCAFLAERVVPSMVVLDVQPSRASMLPTEMSGNAVQPKASGVPCVLGSYVGRAAVRLKSAHGGISFDESLQIQRMARQLSANRSRLASELRQQVKRLQAVTDEKVALTDELRALQDSHALLCSNFQVMQETASKGGADGGGHWPASGSGGATATSPLLFASAEKSPGGPSDLLLSSRQRALLDSLSVTAQESASLRQHGFFVDVISLSAGEVALAAGPPGAEAFESWEESVRKVYEQHVRNLQAQVRAADGKAVELHLSMQQNMDLLKEQEEVKQKFRDQVTFKNQQLNNVLDDIATTRKNYDMQLATLTEHICGLSAKLSEKDSSLASLQAQKVLCGHCGMWNALGKLLSSEAKGLCQTCKEKVLSRG